MILPMLFGGNKYHHMGVFYSSFFRQNPDILLYMCSTDDGQQAQRARLFLRWFNGAKQQEQYVIRTTEVKGD